MIGQIGHLGQVSPMKGLASAGLYAAGAAMGAAVTGSLLGAAGRALWWLAGFDGPRRVPALVATLGALAVVGGLRDLGVLRFSLPGPRCQVPRPWFRIFGPNVAGFLWGVMIGAGYRTQIQYASYYVVAVTVIALGSAPWGAAIMGVYGLSQGLSLMADTAAMGLGLAGPQGLLGPRRSGHMYRLSGCALLACGAWLLAALLRRSA